MLPSWNLVLWSFAYPVSALFSLGIAVDVLLRDRKSLLHRLFFAFGLVSTSYLLVNFFVVNAPGPDEAVRLLRFSNALYFISIAMLAYFVHTLAKMEKGSWLLFIPPMLAVTAAVFIPYDLKLTDFGWRFQAIPSFEGLVVFLYLLSYSLLIAILLYRLAKEARVPWLSRKYWLMLLGFVIFQVFGVFFFNAILLLWSDLPHIGGLLYFLSLIPIWVGFKMEQPSGVGLTQMGGEFSDTYKKFISRFLEVAPSDELGLKTVNLLEYLDKTRLSEIVTYDRLRIILNVEKLDQLDNIQALDKTMEYLEGKEWSDKLAGPFTEVLENVYTSISPDPDKTDAFKEVVANHQAFLMRTDVMYGFSRGQFLELVGPDGSLVGLPEWEVSLRIYTRLLLPIRRFITGPIVAEFYKRLRSLDLAKHLEASQDGEIRTEKLVSYLETVPEERRASAIRDGFDPLISWIAQTLASSDPTSFTKWMKTVRRIVVMNADAKGTWRTFASLANRLSKDMGRDRVRDIVLLEGSRPESLDVFSGAFGLSHEKLLHEKILVEYDPRFLYEALVTQAIEEISANTERCVVFTRRGSAIHRVAEGVGNCEVIVLATPGAQDAASVPFNDITRIIHATGKALESELETWILFDNLSDLMFSTSFEQAYVFTRHATDVIASKNGSALFLMNKSAHSQADRAAFEGLFSKIVEIGEKLVPVKR